MNSNAYHMPAVCAPRAGVAPCIGHILASNTTCNLKRVGPTSPRHQTSSHPCPATIRIRAQSEAPLAAYSCRQQEASASRADIYNPCRRHRCRRGSGMRGQRWPTRPVQTIVQGLAHAPGEITEPLNLQVRSQSASGKPRSHLQRVVSERHDDARPFLPRAARSSRESRPAARRSAMRVTGGE